MDKIMNAEEKFLDISEKYHDSNKNMSILCALIGDYIPDEISPRDLFATVLHLQILLQSHNNHDKHDKISTAAEYTFPQIAKLPQVIDEEFPREFAEEFRKLMQQIGYSPKYVSFDFEENKHIGIATKWWTKKVTGLKENIDNFAYDLAIYIYNAIKIDGICDLNTYSKYNYIYFLLKKYDLKLNSEENIRSMIITNQYIKYRGDAQNEEKLLWSSPISKEENFDENISRIDDNLLKNIKW